MENQTLLPPASEDDRSLAMWMHLGPLLANLVQIVLPFPFLGLGTSLFLYHTHCEKPELVRENGRESLNFQLTLTLIWVAVFTIAMIFAGGMIFGAIFDGSASFLEPANSGFSMFLSVLSFLGLMTLAWLASVVFMIIGSLRARDGAVYRYPIFWRLMKQRSGPETGTAAQAL